MKSIILIFLFLAALNQNSVAQNHLQDTLWNHKMEESEIILKVKITNRNHMTEIGIYSCEVQKIIKGDFKEKILSFDVDIVESSTDRWKKRFNAIETKDIVTIGFKKAEYYTDIVVNGIKYEFFMSE